MSLIGTVMNWPSEAVHHYVNNGQTIRPVLRITTKSYRTLYRNAWLATITLSRPSLRCIHGRNFLARVISDVILRERRLFLNDKRECHGYRRGRSRFVSFTDNTVIKSF